ncbi:MAG TPA: class I SAM-dependent methyltransferase [Verrucomicrobiota bacterium]|nr:class I SAM-dependent methyltransferase [Verrucomicrobiota bacterium]
MMKFDRRSKRQFPNSSEEWADAAATIGSSNGGLTLEVMGFQVMQEWESPLMATMAGAIASEGGVVLEVGYGLGISSRFIRSLKPKTHVIIEANHAIAARARSDLRSAILEKQVHLVEDFWEAVAASDELRVFAPSGFDGILFDTYPLSKDKLRRNHFEFFPYAHTLLAEGGRFTYFSDEDEALSETHTRLLKNYFPGGRIETEMVHVDPWKGCEYWESRTILHVMVTKTAVRG